MGLVYCLSEAEAKEGEREEEDEEEVHGMRLVLKSNIFPSILCS
jgi:hypothetical protein